MFADVVKSFAAAGFGNNVHINSLVVLIILKCLFTRTTTAQDLVNVADVSLDAFCTSYPQYSPQGSFNKPCRGAIDGQQTTINRWSFTGDPVGSWIQITFDKFYRISQARFMPLYYSNQRTFKEVMVEFDANQNLTEEFQGSREVNVSFIRFSTGWSWESATFSPRGARRVRMTVLSRYSSATPSEQLQSGLIELEYLIRPEIETTTNAYESTLATDTSTLATDTSTDAITMARVPVKSVQSSGQIMQMAIVYMTIASIGMLIFLAGMVFLLISWRGTKSLSLSTWNTN